MNEKEAIMKIVDKKKEIKKHLRQAKSIFIMSHKDLDLDALGSSLGMYFLLSRLHKNCYLIIDDERHELGVAKVLQELDGCINILTSDKVEDNLYIRQKRNLLLILDTNKTDLIQSSKVLDFFLEDQIIIFDHHDTGATSIESSLRIIDNEVSSTCEMVTNLLESYQITLDPYYATLILAGVVLDTNNFTLKTNANTYYSAYYLAMMGASSKKVQYLLKQDLKEYMERQTMITNVDILNEKIAISKGSPYTIYRKDELAKTADTLLFFNNIELSFVIGKINEKDVYVSGRSLGKYNVANILGKLGGGGDQMGAAARISNSSISKVEQKLLQILKKEE